MARRARGEGCLMRRPDSRLWWAQWYVNGKAVRKSTGTDVKAEALTKLRKFMGDTERGIPVADGKLRYASLRAALIDDYVRKGNKSLVQRADGVETVVGLPQLDTACGYKPAKDGQPEEPGILISAITTEWTRKFSRDRMAELQDKRGPNAGAAMTNRSLQCLRRGLNILREDGKVAVVPKIRLHKEPGARKGFLEPARFAELLSALPSYLRPLIAMLYWSGMRKGEALAIDWAQVDLQRREIRLEDEQTKSDEGRVLPLHPEVAALLQDREPKHGPVFDATNLRTEWEKACDATGLGKRVKVEGPAYDWHKYAGLRLHDMRRSAVRNMRVLGNVAETVAMKISGHKTRAVFDRYNIVTTGDLHAAMQAVAVGAAKALPAVANGNGSRAKSKGKLSVRRAVLTGRTRSKPA
jgi:integrase